MTGGDLAALVGALAPKVVLPGVQFYFLTLGLIPISFALAAGSLNMASDTLRAILDSQTNAAGTDAEELEAMVQKLGQTFDRFESAEEKFWEALGKKN